MDRVRIENAVELGKAGISSESVLELQRIARALHRLDERACNEDLTCPACGGAHDKYKSCQRCGGTGSITGKKETQLEKRATELVEEFGFGVYRQGDPRGWPLWIYPKKAVNKAAKERGIKPESYIASNYNQFWAVCPH